MNKLSNRFHATAISRPATAHATPTGAVLAAALVTAPKSIAWQWGKRAKTRCSAKCSTAKQKTRSQKMSRCLHTLRTHSHTLSTHSHTLHTYIHTHTLKTKNECNQIEKNKCKKASSLLQKQVKIQPRDLHDFDTQLAHPHLGHASKPSFCRSQNCCCCCCCSFVDIFFCRSQNKTAAVIITTAVTTAAVLRVRDALLTSTTEEITATQWLAVTL